MCDLAYAAQREEIIAVALANVQLAPHVQDRTSITPPDVAVAEFDEWVHGRPEVLDKSPEEIELHELLYGRKGR